MKMHVVYKGWEASLYVFHGPAITTTVTAAATLPLLHQLDRAIQLLLQASSAQPQEPNVWFTLATALARKVCSALCMLLCAVTCFAYTSLSVQATHENMRHPCICGDMLCFMSQGGQQAMCCIAYHRTLQLLQAADAGQTEVRVGLEAELEGINAKFEASHKAKIITC